MAKVKVRMYATVREIAGTAEIEVEATDVEGAFEKLSKKLGDKFSRLLETGDGLVILVNGRNVSRDSGFGTRLLDGDEISLFPPVSGG